MKDASIITLKPYDFHFKDNGLVRHYVATSLFDV